MALHRLFVDDFYDTSFTLIAIHCQIENFRLAYLLNTELKLNLKRTEKDLDFNYLMASYPVFEYYNSYDYSKWNLIGNVCVTETEGLQSSGSLFQGNQKTLTKHYLVPERKNVNYFLKIEKEDQCLNEAILIQSILKIPQIIASYTVNVDELKSKNHLIF